MHQDLSSNSICVSSQIESAMEAIGDEWQYLRRSLYARVVNMDSLSLTALMRKTILELVASTVSRWSDTRMSTWIGPPNQEVRVETGAEEKRKHQLTPEMNSRRLSL